MKDRLWPSACVCQLRSKLTFASTSDSAKDSSRGTPPKFGHGQERPANGVAGQRSVASGINARPFTLRAAITRDQPLTLLNDLVCLAHVINVR